MFSRDVKRLKFSCPNVQLSFSALLKGKMFSINKKGRNYQIGVPLSNDLQNQVKELAQEYCFSEVGRRLRISKGAVSKIVQPYNLTGSMAPKKLNHVRTVPKCTFQDSILLETMVQARGLSSLLCAMISPFTVTAENCQHPQFPEILGTNFKVAATIPEKDWGNVCQSVLLPKI